MHYMPMVATLLCVVGTTGQVEGARLRQLDDEGLVGQHYLPLRVAGARCAWVLSSALTILRQTRLKVLVLAACGLLYRRMCVHDTALRVFALPAARSNVDRSFD